MHDEHKLIHSALEQHYTVDAHTVEICIYRSPQSPWTLEVIDEHGNSTVWQEGFETDQAAFDEVMRTIRCDGITTLVGEPAKTTPSSAIAQSLHQLATPLSEDELRELDAFLLSDFTSDETMLLDHLDGYLTAIVIGPSTLKFSQWYSGIWGPHEEDAPHFESMEQAQRIMQLIVRLNNDIIGSLEDDADAHEPIFCTFAPQDQSREFIDAEMWAAGFMQGLALSRPAWQPLFDDPLGQQWLEPIHLLGSFDLNEMELAKVDKPEQREELAKQIQPSLAAIYRFWLPYREAVHELEQHRTFARKQPKVGRNEPCPCGSGRKFKKCCGLASPLH